MPTKINKKIFIPIAIGIATALSIIKFVLGMSMPIFLIACFFIGTAGAGMYLDIERVFKKNG